LRTCGHPGAVPGRRRGIGRRRARPAPGADLVPAQLLPPALRRRQPADPVRRRRPPGPARRRHRHPHRQRRRTPALGSRRLLRRALRQATVGARVPAETLAGHTGVMLRSPTPAEKIGLSIAVATGLYGISFGALAVAAGLTFWQAMA